MAAIISAELVERDAWLDMFAAAPPDAVAALGLSSERIGGIGLLASEVMTITECNRAMAAGLEAPMTDANLSQMVSWFAERQTLSWSVQVSPLAGGHIRDRLAQSGGFVPHKSWAKFLMRADACTSRPPRTEGAAVVRADAATADIFGRIAQSGFGLPAAAAEWFAALVGRPGWYPYLAMMDGQYIGVATMFVRSGTAWLGMDTTLPSHRLSGVQRALIARRVTDALDSGAVALTAETAWPATDNDPHASSFRNYRRSGFELVYERLNIRRDLVPRPGMGSARS